MTSLVVQRTGWSALALGAAAAMVAPMTAGGTAPLPTSSVTITADGLDLSGTVSSSRAACERDRRVVVFKVLGAKGGEDDVRFASDTTQASGGVGVWSTGNTGVEGRFYAKVRRTSRCAADVSRVIRADSIG